jgi:dihydroorotase-like cyclic amidohydrolase
VPKYVNDLGVSTFKIFMNIRGGEGKRLGLPDIDDGFLLRLCEAAAASGGQVCPHPETIEMSWPLRDRLMAKDPDGKGGLAIWNGSRPPFVEADAIQHAAYVAGVTGTRMYIVHVSSYEALEAGLRQRRSGSRIALETCPHYLTHDVTSTVGDIAKINPPLREAADVEALWKGVLDGHIDTIATDHVHRDAGSKEGGIWKGSPGCPGLETLLPVVLSEGHHKRGLPLSRVADLVARNPARLMGLGDRKGAIEAGFDADIAFVDLNKTWTLKGSDTASSAGYSIYDGWKFKGEVVHTVVRGRWVLRDGALLDDAVGHGRYLHRQPFTSQI